MKATKIVEVVEVMCDFCGTTIIGCPAVTIGTFVMERRFHYCAEECFWAQMTNTVGRNYRDFDVMQRVQDRKIEDLRETS